LDHVGMGGVTRIIVTGEAGVVESRATAFVACGTSLL
jgi:hypothetical protein